MTRGIKTPDTLAEILATTTATNNGCLEAGAKGYPMIKWGDKRRRLSRIILEMTGYDMSDKKKYACHTCDNPKCINPEHLFIGTSSDNQKDHWNKVKAGKRIRMKYNSD